MDPAPSDSVMTLYGEVLLEPGLRMLREAFCRTVTSSLVSIGGWIGVDSFIGAGDMDDTSGHEPHSVDRDRHAAFRALAAVIEMASELATGAIGLLDGGQRFAAAALIRQLIETEYLLKAFSVDFTEAARWAGSTPDDIRRSFAPKTMRSVGGFSNREYWQHCDMGGHPAPSGRVLLRFNLVVPPSEDEVMTASVWGDLAQHLRRLWVTLDELLQREHARYETVRAGDHGPVREAIDEWVSLDPFAFTVDFALLEKLSQE